MRFCVSVADEIAEFVFNNSRINGNSRDGIIIYAYSEIDAHESINFDLCVNFPSRKCINLDLFVFNPDSDVINLDLCVPVGFRHRINFDLWEINTIGDLLPSATQHATQENDLSWVALYSRKHGESETASQCYPAFPKVIAYAHAHTHAHTRTYARTRTHART